MTENDPDKDGRGRTTIDGADARQGEIILNTRGRRMVFVAGLIGFVIVAIIGGLSLR